MGFETMLERLIEQTKMTDKPLEFKLCDLIEDYGLIEFYDRLINILNNRGKSADDPTESQLIDGLVMYAEKCLDVARILSSMKDRGDRC